MIQPSKHNIGVEYFGFPQVRFCDPLLVKKTGSPGGVKIKFGGLQTRPTGT